MFHIPRHLLIRSLLNKIPAPDFRKTQSGDPRIQNPESRIINCRIRELTFARFMIGVRDPLFGLVRTRILFLYSPQSSEARDLIWFDFILIFFLFFIFYFYFWISPHSNWFRHFSSLYMRDSTDHLVVQSFLSSGSWIQGTFEAIDHVHWSGS